MKLTTPIATGNTAEIYLWDGKVVKVYFREPIDAVEHEARNQTYAKSLGLPVPDVIELTEIDGRPALIMEHITGNTLLSLVEREPDSLEKHLTLSVEMQRSIHSLAAPGLRPMSDRLAQKIRSVDAIDANRKKELIAMLGEVGEETRLCHGDFHVTNIIKGESGLAVIDWMDATRGNPTLDACRSYVLYAEVDSDFAEAYLAKYCRQSGVGRDEVLRWVPVIHAARMSETNTFRSS